MNIEFPSPSSAALTKRCGNAPKHSPFSNSFELILKQNVKKVLERRSHAFPLHYTPAFPTFEEKTSSVCFFGVTTKLSIFGKFLNRKNSSYHE